MEAKIMVQKTTIDRFIALCNGVINMPEPNISTGFLEGKKKIISEMWKKIDTMHDTLIEGTDNDEKVAHDYFAKNEFQTAFNMYDKITVRIETKLAKIKPSTQQLPPMQLPENIILQAANNKSNIKLKPIEIPTFNGEYKGWISFKSMFDSLIHNNKEFNGLQKMHYLKSCLLGEAERLISQFNVTEESYQPAYDVLTDRFHNEVILTDTHIISILSQPNLTSETSDGIKELMDVTVENLRALETLNVDTSTWDPLLLLILVQKLDFDTRHLWEQNLKPKISPTLKQFLEFLSTRFYALGCQQKFKFSIASSSTEPNDRKFNHQNDLPQRACPVCPANHSIFSCEKFRQADQHTRIEMVNGAKLCRTCLRSHTSECAAREGCRVCNGNHHTFLHLN